MQKSEIKWTEKTWNPVTGCTKVSQGCKNCYAETIAKRFWGDRKFTDVICHEDRLEQPLHIKKPSMIFVNSMSDLFHESVSFEFIYEVITAIEFSPQHIFQILTKRPVTAMLFARWYKNKRKGWPLPRNIWVGISAEDIHTFDERRFFLSQIPAAVKFISLEPLLDKITFDFSEVSKPDWIIVGGESGVHARPMKPEWVRSIRDQCKAAGIPFFFKQWGNHIHKDQIQFLSMGEKATHILADSPENKDGFIFAYPKLTGNLLDGIKYEEYPRGVK